MPTHHFTPTTYYNAIGSHAPALRIAPGDTVSAATVDAGGGDATGARVTTPGNPMTGPFYIEGAEEGDTLIVRLDAIQPNRPTGFTAVTVAPNVVDPEFVRELPAQHTVEWQIDYERNTATPEFALAEGVRLSLPLRPMIGCFGVAPPRGQAISTATSDTHGGNMDYKGFVAGVTVYFPVFVEGALFHLGDVHAMQGAGEIVGTGIEISAQVEFTVDLQKGKTISWPRGEDRDWIFTCGNARPLDQALQHATTEMIRWLVADYGLDHASASLLLGQVVEYDVGNVFDPAYTMVCKVRKEVLAQLRPSR